MNSIAARDFSGLADGYSTQRRKAITEITGQPGLQSYNDPTNRK